jgi:hypothetical protein
MDATPLDALFPPPGGSPQNAPPLPSSTTYTPVVTPGTMQYTAPQQGSTAPATPYVKGVLRTIVLYLCVFLATMVLSIPMVQSLGLRYIPGVYSSGGTLSFTGAAVVGLAVVVLSYILQSVLTPILV